MCICYLGLRYACYMPRQSHVSWFHQSYVLWRRVQIIKLLCNFLQPLIIFFLLGPNISVDLQICCSAALEMQNSTADIF
jgi:hypothetical protein